LAAAPDMDAEGLGAAIVRHYVDSYRRRGTAVTQSAIATARIGPVCEAASNLGDALLPALSSNAAWGRLSQMQRQVQRFKDREYVDLGHMARLLADSDKRGRAGKAAADVLTVLGPGMTPVLAEAHSGTGLDHATGLSIYLPSPRGLSPLYSTLDFAADYHWGAFLNAYCGTA
jgi:hypothetical protein